MAAEKRPCFLVLMADQLAASWLPIYGHPVVQAPHLSELARGATVFDSAYTPFPLCAPARAAMLTGRYASEVGVYDNAAELRAGAPTVAHALRAAGYHTAVAGKMHFVGPDQLHGFEERLTTDIYPADVDWTPDWSRSLDEALPWYHTMESVLTPGICAASMQTDYDEEVAFTATRKLYEIARHRADQPFFLFVSFTNPHDPWEIPARHWDRYRRDQIDDPAVPALPLDTVDPHSRRLRAMCRVDEEGLTAAQIRRARHGYYAAVSYLDERVGEVLRALRDSGLHERTTVLFCADHGEMLGERGLWYKMSFLQHSARVPLIVRRPAGEGAGGGPEARAGDGAEARTGGGAEARTGGGAEARTGGGAEARAGGGAEARAGGGAEARAGGRGRVAGPVSLLDVAPTLLELAGLDPDAIAGAGDGVSLAPALHGGEAPEHPVVSEYHAEGVQAPSAMIRSGAHKLIVSLQDPDLLYDLARDPRELHDRSGDPDSARVAAGLREQLQQRLDLSDIDRRVRQSQRERWLVSRALRQGRPTSWDFQPAVDAARQYIRNREDMYELQRRARLDSAVPE